MQQKSIIGIIALLSIFTLVFQSCDKQIEDYVPREFLNENESSLRVINTITIPRRINLFVNDIKVNGDSLAFQSTYPASEFLRVPSGSVSFKTTVAATNTNILTSALNFTAGKFQTLFLLDTLPNVDYYMVTDDALVPPPDSGKAFIRFVNVAIGVGNLNLVNTTTATAVDTLVKNISYKGHSQFQKVNAGTAQKFQLYATGSTTKVGTEITGVTISANRIYTLYARGRNGAVAPYVPALSSMVTR